MKQCTHRPVRHRSNQTKFVVSGRYGQKFITITYQINCTDVTCHGLVLKCRYFSVLYEMDLSLAIKGQMSFKESQSSEVISQKKIATVSCFSCVKNIFVIIAKNPFANYLCPKRWIGGKEIHNSFF